MTGEDVTETREILVVSLASYGLTLPIQDVPNLRKCQKFRNTEN